jgi:hypothetical protein
MPVSHPRLMALVEKNYTAEQRQKLMRITQQEQMRINDGWTALFEDIAQLGPQPDARSAKAQELAKRAHALLTEFSKGDAGVLKSAVAMNRDIAKDPEMVRSMRGQEHWPFIDKVLTDLKLIDRA